MKNTIKALLFLSIFSILFISCEKENEEGELNISFKTAAGYVYSDATLASETAVKIGIEAETSKATDPIIKFNISESVNGGTPTTVYSQDLESANFTYDYAFTLSDATTGNTHKYTFTITNRDGINKQAALTITIQ